MPEKILVATDGSDHSRKTLEYAARLASRLDSELDIVHVVQESKVPESVMAFIKEEHIRESPEYVYLEMAGRKIIQQAEELVGGLGLSKVRSILLQGDPADQIVRTARDGGADIIVLGSHGLGSVRERLLGSVSTKVCNLAEVTCMIVK